MRRMGDRERRRLMSSISTTLSTLRKTAGHRHTPVRAVVPVWDAAHGGQSCPATKCEMKQKAMEEALKTLGREKQDQILPSRGGLQKSLIVSYHSEKMGNERKEKL